MNIKIAIAEDNNFLAQSIEEKLALFDDFKFKFRGKNGAELIGKLEEDHVIDVILMDIQMPEMDGIKATELIKNRYPQIKIIILTVFDDDENIFNAMKRETEGDSRVPGFGVRVSGQVPVSSQYLEDRRHLDGPKASKMLAFPSFLRGYKFRFKI